MAYDPKDFIKVSIDTATKVPEKVQFIQVFRNKYWASDDEDNIYFHKGYSSPQCNGQEEITQACMKAFKKMPYTKVIFLEKVFVELDPYKFVNG